MKKTAKIESGFLVTVVLTVAITAAVMGVWLFDGSPETTSLPSEYTYDIEKYIKIDPALIQYHPVGEAVQTNLKVTHAIATDDAGYIYAAGDRKIIQYDMKLNRVKEIDLESEPTCLVIDNKGSLIAGLTNHIGIIDPQGGVENWAPPAANALLTSLAVDDEHLFAADAINKVVWKFDRKGNLLGKIGEKDPDRNIPGMIVPSPYFDLVMADDGLLRVVNPGRHLIEAYTVDGDREWVWGKASMSLEGFSGCCNPVSLAILPDGGFVTAEKGLVRVKTYDPDGNFLSVVAGPDQLGWIDALRASETPADGRSQGFDVAVDARGRVYVLDMGHNVIRMFEKNGN